MTDQRRYRYGNYTALLLAALFPILAIGAIIGLSAVGFTNFLILGSYALPALFLAPVLYKVAGRATIVGGNPGTTEKTALIIAFFLFLSGIIISGVQSPRPRLHFVLLSGCLTIAFLLGVRHNETGLGLAVLTLTHVVFLFATTLTNGLFIGSGDAPVFWIGIKNSIIASSLQPTAGYGDFPLFFAIGAIIGRLNGLSANVSMYVLGATGYTLVPWIVTVFSDKLRFVSGRYRITPAIVLSLAYNFHYMGTYSIPRTLFAELAAVVLALTIGELYSNRRLHFSLERKLLLVIVLAALLGYHKVGQIWMLGLILVFVAGYAVYSVATDDCIPMKRFTAALDGGRGRLLVAAFTIFYIYWLAQSGILEFVVTWVGVFATAIASGFSFGGKTTQGTSIIMTNPIGLASTFVSSGLVLIVFLTGLFVLLRNDEFHHKHTIFGLVGLILAGFYFPGPIHALRSLMGGLAIYRFAKFVLPVVAIIGGVGLARLWMTRSRAQRVLVIGLLLSAGTFTYANDLYSRDNPMAGSGTFKNYLTHGEQAALEFGITNSPRLTSDLIGFDYMAERIHLSDGWGGNARVEPVIVNSTTELCRTPFLYREAEIRTRGFLIIPFVGEIQGTQWTISGARNIRFNSSAEIPGRRDQIYSSGDAMIWGQGDNCV